MTDLIAIEYEEEPVLFITWQTSNVCNFRCSYCNEGNWGGTHPNDQIDHYQKNLGNLLQGMGAQGYRKIKLFLSGGEPTHWQGLIPMLRWFNGLSGWQTTVAINTNLSRPTVWWEKFYHHFDDVVASYHPEWVKDDLFLANAQFLSTRVNYLAVRMMMMEEHWAAQISKANQLYDAIPNLYMEYVPLLAEMSTAAAPYTYRDKSKERWLQKNNLRVKQTSEKPRNRVGGTATYEHWSDGSMRPVNSNRLAAEGANFFKGWQCDLGSSINIAINGDVTLGSCGVSGVICNIIQDIVIDQSLVTYVCTKHHCHCGTDICIPKRKIA